jgi:hypothetical protein
MILVAAVLVIAPAWIARFHFDGGQTLWVDTPLLGVSSILRGPGWATTLVRFSISAAVLLTLAPAVQAALGDATQQVRNASSERMVPGWLGYQHPQFGTFTGAVNVAAGAAAVVLVASTARVPWLARAYAVSIDCEKAIRSPAVIEHRGTFALADRWSRWVCR